MVKLKISPEEASQLLNEKCGEIERMIMKGQVLDFYDFIGWCSGIWSVIDEIYGAENYHSEEIRNLGGPSCSCRGSTEVQRMHLEMYHSRLVHYRDEILQMEEKQEN